MELAIPEVDETAGKRERILRAAVDVFAEAGYFNSRVSTIAKAAGVADGTIYLYFSGKEDLLVTIFQEQMRFFLRRLAEEMDGVENPEDRLRRTIRLHLAASGQDRRLAVVFQVELRHQLKYMTLFSRQELADYLNHLRDTIGDGQKKRLFRNDIHPQLAAKAIFGMLDEMVTSWVISEKDYRLVDSAEPLAAFVLRGLRA